MKLFLSLSYAWLEAYFILTSLNLVEILYYTWLKCITTAKAHEVLFVYAVTTIIFLKYKTISQKITFGSPTV
jgi:hypothetical protein